jgi:large subunit ribosomal protein L23
MKRDSYQIILRPLITEKGMSGATHLNQYPFEVHMGASKADVKKAVEEIFSVHVRKVRTMTRHGKSHRSRYVKSAARPWKRAIVTLAPGENIEFI